MTLQNGLVQVEVVSPNSPLVCGSVNGTILRLSGCWCGCVRLRKPVRSFFGGYRGRCGEVKNSDRFILVDGDCVRCSS